MPDQHCFLEISLPWCLNAEFLALENSIVGIRISKENGE